MNELVEIQKFRSHLDDMDAAALERARARALSAPVDRSATGSVRGTVARFIRIRPAAATGERPVVGTPGQGPDRRRGRLLLVPSAALAVAAVVLGVGLTAGPGPLAPGEPAATGPGPGISVSPQPSTAASRNAAELIERLAVRAAMGETPPSVADTVVETVSTFQNVPGQWTTERYRTEPYGLIMSQSKEFSSLASYRAWVRQQREDLERQGPSMRQPTPEWLASVDPGPANLRRLFVAACACPGGDEEWQMRNGVVELNRLGGVLLPPRLKAGLLRLLGSLAGATATPAEVRGTPVLAIGFPHEDEIAEVYADAETGAIIGAGRIRLRQVADPTRCGKTRGASEASTPACQRIAVRDPQRYVNAVFSTRLVPAH